MENPNTRFTIIHPEARVGKRVKIGNFVIIGKGVELEKDVYIANGVHIYGHALIKEGTYIGDNCIIGHPQRSHLTRIYEERLDPCEFEGPNVRIGKNCVIRGGCIIYSEVIMGENCQTGHNVMIREKTEISDNTLVGTNTIIDGNVKIGKNVSIQTGVYIPLHSEIENDAFLGPYTKLTNDKYMLRKEYDLQGPIIEDHVSLGANSVILPGITIKKRTVIGAGAVVTKDTNEGDIIIGNPGRLLKKIPEDWK